VPFAKCRLCSARCAVCANGGLVFCGKGEAPPGDNDPLHFPGLRAEGDPDDLRQVTPAGSCRGSATIQLSQSWSQSQPATMSAMRLERQAIAHGIGVPAAAAGTGTAHAAANALGEPTAGSEALAVAGVGGRSCGRMRGCLQIGREEERRCLALLSAARAEAPPDDLANERTKPPDSEQGGESTCRPPCERTKASLRSCQGLVRSLAA
jgi:hypothetical protein